MTPTFVNPDGRFCALKCGVAGAIRGKIGAINEPPVRVFGDPRPRALDDCKESPDE